MAKLINHSITPIRGNITFNVNGLSIGFLSQHLYIFTDSIRNNIAMYSKDISEKDIIHVLDEVNLIDKVLSLQNGIDTQIGGGGEMLSGGQMRRVELSCLLVMRPDVVIFYKPATGLDVETESIIQNVLNTHFKQNTVFIIAHRDLTIKQAERRIYLKCGQIVENDALISVAQSEVNDN